MNPEWKPGRCPHAAPHGRPRRWADHPGDARAYQFDDQGAARSRLGPHVLQRGCAHHAPAIGRPSIAEEEAQISELVLRARQNAGERVVAARQMKHLRSRNRLAVLKVVRRRDIADIGRVLREQAALKSQRFEQKILN